MRTLLITLLLFLLATTSHAFDLTYPHTLTKENINKIFHAHLKTLNVPSGQTTCPQHFYSRGCFWMQLINFKTGKWINEYLVFTDDRKCILVYKQEDKQELWYPVHISHPEWIRFNDGPFGWWDSDPRFLWASFHFARPRKEWADSIKKGVSWNQK